MTQPDSKLPDALLESLREGTFPSSDDLLTSEVSPSDVSRILESVSGAKKELSAEIRELSRGQAGDVDEWIRQAKQVQQDIAECKAAAREIVREHEKVRELDGVAKDAQAKTDLLRGEIEFSTALQKELEGIGASNEVLDRLSGTISQGGLIEAARDLGKLGTTLRKERPSRFNAIFEERRRRLVKTCHQGLEEAWSSKLKIGKDLGSSSIEVVPDHADSSSTPPLGTLLESFDHLGAFDSVIDSTKNALLECIVHPLLLRKPNSSASVSVKQSLFTLKIEQREPVTETVLENVQIFLEFLHINMPTILISLLVSKIMPEIVQRVEDDWLDESVPFELSDIHRLEDLKDRVIKLASTLSTYDWPGSQQLLQWVKGAPSLWLARRKMNSLQGVRKALKTRRGPTREVERTETEKVAMSGAENPANGKSNSRSPTHMEATSNEDDEANGWDFEDEEFQNEEEKPAPSERQAGEEEVEEAWGWDDEEDSGKINRGNNATGTKSKLNGNHAEQGNQELTLRETYTITDIPDYLLEIMGRDILDAQTVKGADYSALATTFPSDGLLALPAVVLAMFRATAPRYYNDYLTSGNMHLYNDSQFIAQKLRKVANPQELNWFEAECTNMERFGKIAYSKEMDTQRTILRDLLDGAQGFVNCTQAPNSTECENAVASVIDRVRTIHGSWKPILSNSTLLQAIGNLLSTVIGKIIEDVEDMEDISETQSQRLTSLFERIKSLEDIFIAPVLDVTSLGGTSHEEEPAPQTMIYCPNWLKFGYLIDILDSRLDDIKYLWSHGMLGLEYSRDEIIDLVKALFSESVQRKTFINDIRRIEPGQQFQG